MILDNETQVGSNEALPLRDSLAKLGINILHQGEGKIARPTAGSESKTAELGVKMYLGITSELQNELGIKQGDLTNHVAITLIEGSNPPSFNVYLLSAMVDDARFLKYAAAGKYHFDTKEAKEITSTHQITKESISMPSSTLGIEQKFAIIDPRELEGKILPTTLGVTDYEQYPESLRKSWEAANRDNLPVVVVPNGIAKLLGLDLGSSTNLKTNGDDKTVAIGSACDLQMEADGEKTIKVFVVGARGSLGLEKKLRNELGLQDKQELRLEIAAGEKLIKIDRRVESIMAKTRKKVLT